MTLQYKLPPCEPQWLDFNILLRTSFIAQHTVIQGPDQGVKAKSIRKPSWVNITFIDKVNYEYLYVKWGSLGMNTIKSETRVITDKYKTIDIYYTYIDTTF